MKQFVTEIWNVGNLLDIKLSYENIPEVSKLSERNELVDFSDGGLKRVRYWVRVARPVTSFEKGNVKNSWELFQEKKLARAKAKQNRKIADNLARAERITRYRELVEQGKEIWG